MSGTILRSGELYGRTRIHRTIPGFKLLEVSYPGGVKLPNHFHDTPCFSFMLKGAMSEIYGGRILEMRPHTVCFNAAHDRHRNAVASVGAHFVVLEIDMNLVRHIHGWSAAFATSAIFKGGELASLGSKLHRESLQDDAVTPMALEGIALEIVAGLFRMNCERRERKSPSWLAEARDFIHAQFTEPLSIAEIANVAGVHPVHLARTFRKHHGASISD